LTLPKTLRLEISLFLNKDILEKVSLFKNADEVFIHEVIEELEPLVFLPGDFVIRQGELGDCMYFLSSGSVEVIVDGKQVAVLAEGSPVGETALIENEKRNASIRAVSYCDVYRLSQHSFEQLRKNIPNLTNGSLKFLRNARKPWKTYPPKDLSCSWHLKGIAGLLFILFADFLQHKNALLCKAPCV